jgi:hypothetical protein
MIVRHPVQDFSTWKPHFDAHQSQQHQHGLKLLHLLRNTENKNDLTIHFEVTDVEKAKQFIQSNDLKETMQKAGVIGKPEILFLKDAKDV